MGEDERDRYPALFRTPSGEDPQEVAVRLLLRIPVALPVVLALPLVLVLGAVWWWAVVRLAVVPADAGPVEGAIAMGGWGLGLLPVHCVPGPVRRARGGDRADPPDAPDPPEGGGGHQGIDTPPFGRRIWPVMKDEASEAR
ncbi:hypothetical protein [Streptomyces sp. NPDC059708]|uniref:hypothetical protein n=1 Tax=Streptomyces sp. NPDC059708 TaxID=3346916 RepID=UPI00368BDE35